MEGIPDKESQSEAYKRRLFELTHNIEGDSIVDYYDDMNTLVEKLRQQSPDIINYELYHILIGSTPMPGQKFAGFDLPNGEIEAIISELENKYGKR